MTESALNPERRKRAQGQRGYGGRDFVNTDGLFRVRIDGVRETKNRNGAPRVFHDFTILESSDPSAQPVGARRSEHISILWDSGMEKIGRFLWAVAAAVNPEDEEQAEKDHQELVDNMQSHYNGACGFEGVELTLETKTVETNAGKPFTRYMWSAPQDLGGSTAGAEDAGGNPFA